LTVAVACLESGDFDYQAEQVLSDLLAELNFWDLTACITVITHSQPSELSVVLDTIVQLTEVASLDGHEIQGSKLPSEGIDAYYDALRESRSILQQAGGSIGSRMIVMTW
jgi:hypothetical protein